MCSINNYTFFYKQHFDKQHQAELQKIKQKLSDTLRLNFCDLKIIHIFHPHHHPKIIERTLKIKQKNKCVCIHEIIRLIIMKMEKKKKNGSHRFDIIRSRSRHGNKYSKYKNCLIMIKVILTKKVSHYDNAYMY